MSPLLRILVGAALSALTLYFFFRNLDVAKVAEGISAANPALLALAVAIGYFGHLAVRARRWATMLAPLKEKVSFYNLYSTTAIGYAVSWLMPGRLGEVVRPVLLARREAIPVGATLATVAVERMLDAATVLVLASLAALAAPIWAEAPDESVLRGAIAFGLGALVLTAAAGWTARTLVREGGWFETKLEAAEARASGTRKRLVRLLRTLASGAHFLRDPRRAARVAAESALLWIVLALATWVGLLAAGVRVPFVGVFPLMALAVLGIAVPTPGGAGPVHFAFQQGLIRLFAIDENRASVATIIYHPVLVYIPPVLFGLAFAWRDGLTPSQVRVLAGKRGGTEEASPRP
jgi:hypothetical protein